MVVVTSSERLRRPPSFQWEGKVGRGLAPAEGKKKKKVRE